MIINKKNGNLKIYDDFVISKELQTSDMEAKNLNKYILSVNKDYYTKIELKPVELSNRVFCISLYFNNNEKLELIIMVKKYDYNWNNYNESIIREHKKENDAWLCKELGNGSYKYLWGNLSSTFDQKGGYSPIVIKYSN
jgi:hypothetical protein